MRPRQNKETRAHEILAIAVVSALIITTAAILHKTTNDSFNQITGAVLSTVNISPLAAQPCNFTAQPGLNLVSFFCITYETPLADVVENITQLAAIFEYEEGQADPWKVYNPDLPSWVVQDLETLSRTEGYWLDMKSSEQVIVSGGLRIPTNIPLVPGWNLVGYPTNETKSRNISFLTISGNFTEVRGFNNTNKVFINYIPPSSGGLLYTRPNEGYWINITATEVWIVD